MKTAKRFDISIMDEAEKTSQGFLRIPVFATRTGIFKYRDADGNIFNELRPEEEVFDAKSLETLKSAPITLQHPPEMVNPENAAKYMKGYLVDSVKTEDNKLSSVAIITHKDAIDAVMNGKMREVSCGYSAEIDPTPGEWNGIKYDSIQRNIRYNHLAIVDQGRAGPDVRLRLDAADAVMEAGNNQRSKEDSMEKLMLGGKEFEVQPELKAAIEAEMQKMKEEMDAYMKDGQKSKDEMAGKMDAIKEELEKLKTEKKDSLSEDEIKSRVKSRIKIERVASKVLSSEVFEKIDSMTDLEVQTEVIKADSKSVNLEGKSEHYIAARFDMVCEKLEARNDKESDLGSHIVNSRKDGTESLADKAREKMMEEARNAWNKQKVKGE